MDVLLLHPSGHLNKPSFSFMPMGMIGFANLLNREGFSTEIINWAVELSLDPHADIVSTLREIDFSIVAIDLHWHEHAFTALELARLCKLVNPNCFTVLGGFTATFFANEIISSYPYVDAVIRGDAELPLLELARAARGDRLKERLAEIPNLIYKRERQVKESKSRYLNTDLDELDFVETTLIRHRDAYYKVDMNGVSRWRFWKHYWIEIGRGCVFQCSWCGGSKNSHSIITERSSLGFRSPRKVAEDLIELSRQGIHTANLSHDIELRGEKFWKEIFGLLRKEKVDLGMYMEVYQLPSKEFRNHVAKTFSLPFTCLAISPTSGNESIRKLNGKYFTSVMLEEALQHLTGLGIPYQLFFSQGLPFEIPSDLKFTFEYAKRLLERYVPQSVEFAILALDPASPMMLYPDKFRLILHLNSFRDYYERSRKRALGEPYDYSGYHTQDLGPEGILALPRMWKEEISQLQNAYLSANNTYSYTQFI